MWKTTRSSIVGHKLRLALSAFAVVLGVAFIAGTMVLTDTLHKTFNDLFTGLYEHVDLNVRSTAAFDVQGDAVRKPVDAELVDTIRTVPGVKAAEGTVASFA